MRIQHNIMAMNAYRNYNNNTSALSKNLEKLSSGYKINRAGDDAAGLAISEKMRAQITGLNAAQKNVKDGISLVKTAEGAMQEIEDMLNRMKYLATQSANGTYDKDVDRANLQKEVDALRSEIDRIADSANFNGIQLLDGKMGFGGGSTTNGVTMNTETPTATVDATNAAGVKGVTFTKDAAVTDEAINSFNTALGETGMTFKVETTAIANAGTLTAADTLKLDLSNLIDAGYTVTYQDGSGAEATLATGEQALTVGTAAGNIAAGTSITLSVADADGTKVGDIVIDMSDTTTTAGASTVTMTAGAAAAAAAADAPAAADPGGFKFALTGTTALADTETLVVNGKTYTVQNDGTIKNDAGTAIDDPANAGTNFNGNNLDDQLAAIAADYNATANDANFEAVYDAATKEFKFNAKAGVDLDTVTTPTLTTSAATLTIPAQAEKVEPTEGDDPAVVPGGTAGNGTLVLQIGDTADSFNQLTVRVGDMHVSKMGGKFTMTSNPDGTTTYVGNDAAGSTIADIDISDQATAKTAIDVIKNAINYVSSVRGDLGAVQNRLEHTANNLSVMAENIQDAESTIRDTDVADEMMAYTKNNILIQSAQAMLAQANAVPQGVLQLLQ